jgi:SAM-dependent methyltransferase
MPAVEWQGRVDAHFQASAQYWKQLYQNDGVFEVIHQQRRDRVLGIVETLELPQPSQILEIGCGAGATAIPLAQRGHSVDAVDTVNEMLQLTRKAAAEAGVSQRVRTTSEDAHRLSFSDNSFRLAIALGVTPYLHSLSDALREMARVLEPGGYLIVNADNRWRLNYLLDPRRFPALATSRQRLRDWLEHRGLLKSDPAGPRPRMYSRKEFDAALAAAGLQKLQGATLGFGPFSFLNFNFLSEPAGIKVHEKLQALADRRVPVLRSTGAQYIVLAKKPGRKMRGNAA